MVTKILPLGSLEAYAYVVILSKMEGKILLSRHRHRDTWETQGGHIEAGETPLMAARRELMEESGAAVYELTPLFDYVHTVTGLGGIAYRADIARQDALPQFEMAETGLFDALPQNLTYPDITPMLFAEMERMEKIHPFRRILLTVSYDGTAYSGWQYQENAPSVQDELEKALEKALGRFTRVTGASRTDAGVHALGQRAHFDTDATIPPEKYPFVLNRFLPPDIRVTAGRQVPATFHARYQADGKWYTYRIHNAPHASAIYRNLTAHVPVPLDESMMHRAAQQLLGTHDFAAFAAAGGSAKTTVRTIDQVSVERQGDMVVLKIHGNAFLYNMVRIIAGTLCYIGQGKLDEGCIPRALATGNRLELGITAPASGLELTRVEYALDGEKTEA